MHIYIKATQYCLLNTLNVCVHHRRAFQGKEWHISSEELTCPICAAMVGTLLTFVTLLLLTGCQPSEILLSWAFVCPEPPLQALSKDLQFL